MRHQLLRRVFAIAASGVIFGLCAECWFGTTAGAAAGGKGARDREAILLPDEEFSQSQAPAQNTAEKPAEEVYKNIQVLKGMPASQLRATMTFMRASLNVRCDYCHVVEQGGTGWEKDDKQPKKTARKMLQMLFDINKSSFEGRTEVTCNTCHRGERDPIAIPAIGLAPARPEGAPAAARPAETLPAAADLFAKFAQAVGGKEAVEKLKSRMMKGSILTAQGATIPVEIDREAPNKYLVTITLPQGSIVQGFDGTTGWSKSPQGEQTMSGVELASIKRSADFYRDVNLKDRFPRTRVVGKEKLGEHETYVVVGRDTENGRERLFFDTTSGLLIRRITYTDTVVGSVPNQTDYEDYQEVDGVKIPMTIKIAGIDNNANMTQKFSEVKHNVPIEANRFSPSPAK